MAGPGDVIRHVILRITVDQAGLAEELAAARAKLKGLKDEEGKTNRDRVKSTDEVTKALGVQNEQLDKNRAAHEAAQRAAAGRSGKAADDVKAETEAIKANTTARDKQTETEARIQEMRRRSANEEIRDEDRKQQAFNKTDARAQAAAEKAEDRAEAGFISQQDRADRYEKREQTRFESEQTRAEKADARRASRDAADEDRAERSFTTQQERADRNEEREEAAFEKRQERFDKEDDRADRSFDREQTRLDNAARRAASRDKQANKTETFRTDQAQSDAAMAASRARATEDQRLNGIISDRLRLEREELALQRESQRVQNEVDRGGQQAQLAEERIQAAAEARGRAAERAARSGGPVGGGRGATGTLADIALITRRAFTSAPRAAARADVAPKDKRDPDEVVRSATTISGRIEKAFADLGPRIDRGISRTHIGTYLADSFNAGMDKMSARSQRFFSSTRQGFESVRSGAYRAEEGTRKLGNAYGDADKFAKGFATSASRYFGNVRNDAERLRNTVGRMGSAAESAFKSVPRSAEDAAKKFASLGARVRAYAADLDKARSAGAGGGAGGGGGGFFSGVANTVAAAQNKLSSAMQGGARHLISFQSLVLAVIAALGPLAAILGAVGAAALGLASNLGALVGGVAALPGLIGAAVAGFGALAMVMKPLTSVFSAYSAAAKEAATNSKTAAEAALNYKEAVLQESDAETEWKRSKQDGPRLQTAYNDAVKQAKRDIEDYRESLKKLQYQQDSANLGVQSATEQYRRTLADPTATALDRKQALNSLQGAQWDKYDQAKNAKRTQQDASEAFSKGVQGADAVVAAQRAVEDQTNKVAEAYNRWQLAIIATQKAKLASDAGGTAAATLQAELNRLPPLTRKVAQAVIDILKGPYKALRNTLSENIFGPISKETGKFKDIIAELGTFLTPASVAIGKLAKNALDLFTNPDWKKFFSAQGDASGRIITVLGAAALKAADGFRAIVEVAQPFTDFVVAGIGGAAKSFDDFFNSTEKVNGSVTKGEQGRARLTWFLDLTKQRMSELKPVIRDIAIGIGEFFKALNTSGGGQNDFTSWFNKGLQGAAAHFRALGKLAEDPNGGFQKWLRDVRPLLHDVVVFIDQAGRFFGKLFSDHRNIDEARKILQEISTRWLPKLAELFSQLSSSGIISKIAAGIGGIISGLNDFAAHGGTSVLSGVGTVLESVGQGIEVLGKAFDALLTRFPALDGAAKAIGATLSVVFGALLLSKITHLDKVFGLLFKTVRGGARVLDRPETSLGGKVTGGIASKIDNAKDTFFGRTPGESARRRQTRYDTRQNGGTGAPGTPPVAEATSQESVVRLLGEANVWLEKIWENTRHFGGGTSGAGGGGTGGGGGPREPSGGPLVPGRHPNYERYTGRRANGGVVEPYDTGNWRYIHRPEEIAPVREELPTRSQRALTSSASTITGYETEQATHGGRAETGRTDLPELPAGTGGTTKTGKKRRSMFGGSKKRPPGRPLLADVGEDLSVYTGLDEAPQTYTRPAQRRNAAGQFGGDSGTRQTRNSSGRFGGSLADEYVRPETTYEPPAISSRRVDGRTIEGDVVAEPTSSPVHLGNQIDEVHGVSSDAPGPVRPTSPEHADAILRDIAAGGDGRVEDPTVRPRSRLGRLGGRFGKIGKGLFAGLKAVGGAVAAPYLSGDDTGAVGTGGLLSRGGPATSEKLYDEGYTAGYDAATRGASGSQLQLPDVDTGGEEEPKKSRKQRRAERRTARRSRRGRTTASAAEEVLEGDVLTPEEYENVRRRRTTLAEGEPEPTAHAGEPAARRGGRLRNLFRRGVASEAGSEVETLARSGSRLGGLARLGGGLTRGLAGGLVGAALSGAVSLGGDYLTNKFVKNADDRSSLSRGLGAVANGAGIGATIGSIIPGVGTVVGGAIGGLAGGAYSLIKDKNLRNFVGGKISGAAKSVGGFLGDVGSDLGGLFTGGGSSTSGAGKVAATLLGPVGAIFAKTDFGKMIFDSISKGGSKIAEFFTKTIPHWWHLGTQAITTFFTKTLPSLPGKAFDAITTGIGVIIGFFRYDIPRAATAAWHGITTFFTKTLPHAASMAWQAIVGFFTETLPSAAEAAWHGITNFFTKTLPSAASAAWRGITNFFTKTLPADFEALVGEITTFFTKTLPDFFTTTLPQAIAKLPGTIYDKLVSPVVGFFGGLGGHVIDAIRGGWAAFSGWAKGIFDRAGTNIQTGENSQKKMSGGLIAGVYQGIEDTARLAATPGEFVMRRSKAQEPGAMTILSDWNEGRIQVADLYKGLSASTAPQVMSMVPPDAGSYTGAVPTVVNHTVNHAPVMGDVTIHNPVREKSERSLRRQVEIASIRHRR